MASFQRCGARCSGGTSTVRMPRLSRPDPGRKGARHTAGVDSVPRSRPALYPLLRFGRPAAQLRRPRRAGGLDQRSWTEPGKVADLRAAYAGWHPQVQKVIDAVDETFIWAVLDRPPIPRWTFGRITMLGDACHPMIPFMGQGGAMAIEDAAAITAAWCDAATTSRPRSSSTKQSAAADHAGPERLLGEPDPVPHAGRPRPG